MTDGIEILAVKRIDPLSIIVDFSDGTSAFFNATQLAKLGQNRIRIANWPIGPDYQHL